MSPDSVQPVLCTLITLALPTYHDGHFDIHAVYTADSRGNCEGNQIAKNKCMIYNFHDDEVRSRCKIALCTRSGKVRIITLR